MMRHFPFFVVLEKISIIAGLQLLLLAHSAGQATTPRYVQGNSATPRSPGSNPTAKVQVSYAAPQSAGDLNVVIVGWNDASAEISSLTDSEGNVYRLAVGPTLRTGSPALSQSIYYARNISAANAGANVVTATFDVAALYVDLRILEYRGLDPLNPLDVSAAATGNSATSSSGAVMTKNAMDLLVGANVVWTSTTGPGGAMIQRLLTPDGDIAGDRVVTTTGSYNATAPLSSAGPWIMQMVAFRAASSPAPAAPPAPPPTSTSSPLNPTYLQGNSATPTSQATVTVPYTVAQRAGDLNVVIVGWNDATTQVSSLTDSIGNAYQLAVGPTVVMSSPALSQSIYYARNIAKAAAGSNTVRVNFNAAAHYPDIRILEYSGIDQHSPLDVSATATGNSAAASSGAVSTRNARDLLVGTNVVWTSTTGPGSALTQRLLTPDGDIVEDRVVTAVGSYSTSAPLNKAGPWIMQMVAFRAAGGTASTANPNTTKSHTTNFQRAEDPISENREWINGQSVGLGWQNVRTTPGLAYGTQSGSSGRYDDSTAVLAGSWGQSQTVQARVHSVNQNPNIWEEVELRLRTTITANKCTGYEINFRCLKTGGAYMEIVRWNGALGSFTRLAHYNGAQYGVANDDVVKATITGRTITAYINGTQMGQATDGNAFSSGSPGLGFWLQGNANTRDFGFSNFSASD
jgi:hypothetical protein